MEAVFIEAFSYIAVAWPAPFLISDRAPISLDLAVTYAAVEGSREGAFNSRRLISEMCYPGISNGGR